MDGIDRSPEAVEFALKEGYIQRGATENFAPLLAEAGYVVLGLYPTALLDWLKQYGSLLPAGCLVTDTCGVKTGVVDTAQALMPEGVEFIGSHPMAGKEVSGVTNAHLVDFAPANFIITPTEKNTEAGLTFAWSLAETLGFQHITTLTPAEHDQMIGYVSQLTHAIAVSLRQWPPGRIHRRFLPGPDSHRPHQRPDVGRAVFVEPGQPDERDRPV